MGQLEHRIGEVERRLSESDSAAELRDEIRRVSESASSERQSLSEALLARVEEITATTPRAEEMESLRAQLDEVAARPAVDDTLRDRVGRLSERMDRLGEVEATVSHVRTALDNHENVRVNDALANGARLVSLETAIETLEGAENRIREAVAGQIDGVAADAETARGQLRTELGVELRAELGARLDDRAGMLDARIDEHWGETSALRSEIEGLRAAVAARADADARLEQLLDERLEGLSAHVASEVGRVRLDVDTTVTMALDTVRGEATALGARLDHVVGLRSADVEAARAAGAHLEGRLDALAALRADDAEAAQIAADELAERLSALALSLHAEAAGARASAETVAAQVADLHGLRSEDRAATELAGAELAARLDDHAVRSAAAAFEVEQALRDELGGVAARLEERDAQGIEAREELRAELERVGLSVGWRLEQIEVSLAADESAALKVSVAELQHRLDAHAAIGDEQVRTTERALRKGLAALGERLVDTEEAYLEAGNTLRRSIERLGAAVVEADARMADQIPVSTAEGCVAFAPTPDGYRLVELPGPAPELGSTLELEESEGLLVVTRYGRSPLPLDSRPCAYLDRA